MVLRVWQASLTWDWNSDPWFARVERNTEVSERCFDVMGWCSSSNELSESWRSSAVTMSDFSLLRECPKIIIFMWLSKCFYASYSKHVVQILSHSSIWPLFLSCWENESPLISYSSRVLPSWCEIWLEYEVGQAIPSAWSYADWTLEAYTIKQLFHSSCHGEGTNFLLDLSWDYYKLSNRRYKLSSTIWRGLHTAYQREVPRSAIHSIPLCRLWQYAKKSLTPVRRRSDVIDILRSSLSSVKLAFISKNSFDNLSVKDISAGMHAIDASTTPLHNSWGDRWLASSLTYSIWILRRFGCPSLQCLNECERYVTDEKWAFGGQECPGCIQLCISKGVKAAHSCTSSRQRVRLVACALLEHQG